MVHLPTLLLAIAFSSAISGLLVLVLARMHEGTRGARAVAAATLLTAVGLPLMALRDPLHLHPALGIWFANVCFIVALLATSIGVRQMFGLTPARRVLYVLAGGSLLALTLVTLATGRDEPRFLVVNAYSVVLTVHLALHLRRRMTRRRQDLPMRVIHALLWLTAAGFVVRQVWATLASAYGAGFAGSAVHLPVVVPVLLLINASALVTALAIGRDLLEQLTQQAERDPLTMLLNRRGLDTRLRAIADEPWALAVIDADHFKALNDRHGHAVGDTVLRELAFRLSHAARQVDTVSRIGGEEFCLVAPLGSGQIDIRAWAQRLLLRLTGEPVETEAGALRVTASIGCTLRRAGEDFAPAFGRADAALYAAKQAGRHRVVVDGAPGAAATAPEPASA